MQYRIAEVYLFDTCTHRCGYCWLAESGHVLDASQLKPFRDPSFIARVVEFFNSRTTASEKWLLQFTGGEPLLTPNLDALCRPLIGRGNRVAFYTALLLPEGHAGFRFLLDHTAPDVDYVMASLHPEAELDESTYFRKIERLKARGHNVIVRYVGHPARLMGMDAIEARCRDLDVCFYPTTLLSNSHPRGYTEEERASLRSHFTSLSQHIQLAGGLRTDALTCHGGSRLIAVNLQTGKITPCITVDRPSLGNIFDDSLDLQDGPRPCPVRGVSCLCDVHYQQSVVSGIDDSVAFETQKRGFVEPRGSSLPRALEQLAFYSGVGMGIGAVQDTARLFFTKEEVKQRWQSRLRESRIDALGRWSLAAKQEANQASISVQLKDAHPIERVELFLNDAPDGSTTGTWFSIYSAKHSGGDLDLQVATSIGSRGHGRYRVAFNVTFADGTTCYWYAQPPHYLRIGAGS